MDRELYDFIEKMRSTNVEEEGIIYKNSGIDNSIFTDRYRNIISFDKVCPTGKMISIRKHTRFIHYPAHSHDYVEICYVLNGKSVQVIENEEVELLKGDLLFLGPGVTHEIYPTGNDDIIVNFIIHKKFFSYIFEFINETCNLSNFFTDVVFKKSSTSALIFSTKGNGRLEGSLNEMLSELDGDEDLMEPRVKFLLGILVLDLTLEEPIRIEKVSYDQGVLCKVITYMERNLKTANLNEISDQLKMKNYNLSKLIKKESGVTFNNLLREIRFNKFCEIIKIKNISINDLAIEMGFSNTSDFYKKFKAKFGVSPREYRNTH
ncbi:AraC family transcriptional regulator [Vibrio hannami]|uniref:AraC family transcriptional regulator n=1 Tax=Vibrio hannami TaxID=2717094 RepID=UPI00241004BF|nr:AraC family transcriptional regulator [Vibrio hannami]MDG3086440.1 AraC family transcriptional regulator [Vibrio hannami]